MIVLDTDVTSRLGRTRAEGSLSHWLATLSEATCLAAHSVAEIQYGIAVLRGRKPAAASGTSAWLDQVVAAADVLPFGIDAARLSGEMRAIAPLRGLGADLAIAATAITAGFPVATLNQRHFRLIARHFPALVVVDPLGSR